MLAGKVCVVSGVGPGFGRSIALALATHGADLVLAARSEEAVAAVAAEVRALGRETLEASTDITEPDACRRLVDATRERFGRVDVLVNNAHFSQPRVSLEQADLAVWHTSMDVNLWGTLTMTQCMLPLLKESGDGRIIMINSMAAHKIQADYGPYTVSKAALETATKVLAKEVGRFGVRVNSVHPGYIFEDKARQSLVRSAEQRGISLEAMYAEIADETCLKYLPTADEIAGTVLFLASSMAKPITGQSIDVNAGHWIN